VAPTAADELAGPAGPCCTCSWPPVDNVLTVERGMITSKGAMQAGAL
jgi:hypothetical protein